MQQNKILTEQLHRDGYRSTRQRQIILDAIRKSGKHLTAKELYRLVQQQVPQISLGTVYRNLTVLEDLQLIRRLSGDGSSRYDGNVTPHYHITCLSCGNVSDVDPAVLGELNTDLLADTGFDYSGYQLDFYGVCPTCQDSSAKSAEQGD